MLKKIFLREKVIFSAILVNSVIIFLLAFPELKSSLTLEAFDFFFILFFLVEALVKINHLGFKKYMSDNWNVFDFTLVVISLPTLLSEFIHIPNTSIFLLFRILRLVRLFKLMHFIPNMQKIFAGLIRAFKASIFVIIALFMLNIVLAILTCHLYGEKAPHFFEDPLISSYTIFQMFTVEGWNEIPNAVISDSDPEWLSGLIRFYFVMVVLLGGIFGMSLANAIFVDEMTMDNNDEITGKIDDLQQSIDELKKLLSEKN